jgi:CheY-like chemotaxis protein
MLDILEPLGFTVTTAVDGLEAVAGAKAARPDLVLLDLRMPRLDGFGAARAIAEAFPDNPPKMIGVSASAFEPDREARLQAGGLRRVPGQAVPRGGAARRPRAPARLEMAAGGAGRA